VQHKSDNEKKVESSVVKEPSVMVDNKEPKDSLEPKEPMPYMLRILMLVVFAVISFLVEIILFSIIAYFFSVQVNVDTMTPLWKYSFYSLFFIPGVFLFLAFLTFVANTTD
jgi:hypothetical protein